MFAELGQAILQAADRIEELEAEIRRLQIKESARRFMRADEI